MSNNLAPAAADAAPPATPSLNADDQAAADAAAAALAQAPDTSPLDKPEGQGRAADRIADLVAERNAIREYAEYWRTQATTNLPKPAAPAPTVPTARAAPKLDQFANTDGTYNAVAWSDALTKWTDEQVEVRAAAAVDKTLGARETQRAQEQALTSWQERAAAFRAKQPDFDVVVANPALPFNGTLKDLILASDVGPQVAHYMGQPANVAEAVRISRMPPMQQAAAFGRLEAKVSAAPPPPPPKARTNAPPPPNPIRGASGQEVNLATCSMDDYLDARLGRGKK